MASPRLPAWKAEFATRLRAARLLGLSQADLGRQSGVSERMVSLIETGKLTHAPRASTIVRLALAIGDDPQEWLRLAARAMSDKDISALREAVRVKASLEEIEHPEKIKDDIRRETEQKIQKYMAAVEDLQNHIGRFKLPEEIEHSVDKRFRMEMANVIPADVLRRELFAYVDSRLSELRALIGDISERVSQVVRWQNDLAKSIEINEPPSSRTRKTRASR